MGKLGEKITVLVAVSEKTENGCTVDYKPVAPAYAREFLAVHKITDAITTDENLIGSWQITHTITGCMIRQYDSRKEALIVRDAIIEEGPDLDWVFTDPKAGLTRDLTQRVAHIEQVALGALQESQANAGVEAPTSGNADVSDDVPDPQEPDPDELLTVGEVAGILGRSERSVRHLIRKRKLIGLRVGGGVRVYRREAERFRAVHRGENLDDSIPEGAMDLQETADWLKYSNKESLRRLAINGRIPSHKTAVTGRLYFFRDEVTDSFGLAGGKK